MASEVIPTSSLPTTRSAPFKRLKMKHRKIIAEHLAGRSNAQIADSNGWPASYVSSVLRSDAAKPILAEAYADYEMELKALTPGCIDAVRRNLKCGDGQVELAAARLGFKANHLLDRPPEETRTAEDTVERILEKINPDGSRLKMTERRRFTPRILDAEVDPT